MSCFAGMLCTFRLCHSVLWSISCCTQQLSPSPAVTAVTSPATVPATSDRLSKGPCPEKGRGVGGCSEFKAARKSFCRASLPVHVSFCPFCSWQWTGDIFDRLKILLEDELGHSLEAILYCQIQLCYLYRPIWGKQSSILDLLVPWKGHWRVPCWDAEGGRHVQYNLFAVTQSELFAFSTNVGMGEIVPHLPSCGAQVVAQGSPLSFCPTMWWSYDVCSNNMENSLHEFA